MQDVRKIRNRTPLFYISVRKSLFFELLNYRIRFDWLEIMKILNWVSILRHRIFRCLDKLLWNLFWNLFRDFANLLLVSSFGFLKVFYPFLVCSSSPSCSLFHFVTLDFFIFLISQSVLPLFQKQPSMLSLLTIFFLIFFRISYL